MKILFNDATELQIQKAYISEDGALHIKTISATQDQLRDLFTDEMKTKKMIVVEREQTIAVYDGYTQFDGITAYNAGILEPFLYKEGETPEEMISALKEENTQLKEAVDMLTGCMLEMSEMVYQ